MHILPCKHFFVNSNIDMREKKKKSYFLCEIMPWHTENCLISNLAYSHQLMQGMLSKSVWNLKGDVMATESEW